MANRSVETPFDGLGITTGACSTTRLFSSTPFCVTILLPVAALHSASVGLLPVICIQSIFANSEETVVSSLILLAPATKVTGTKAVVVQASQVAVLGNDTLAMTSTPFTKTLAVVALCEPALAYLHCKL